MVPRQCFDRFDPNDLAEAGWGLVVPEETEPEIREALDPLIRWRREQASRIRESRFAILGYERGDTRNSFLSAFEAELDAPYPDQLPYYLLIAGSPEEIPFEFQFSLGLGHAVGRIDFDRKEDYATYAKSVVELEQAIVSERDRHCLLFSPTPDRVSARASMELARPLFRRFSEQKPTGWQFFGSFDENASHRELRSWFGENRVLDLLFVAGHGALTSNRNHLRREIQGSIVITSKTRFGAEDLPPAGSVAGLVAFLFGCCTAGTRLSRQRTRPDNPNPKSSNFTAHFARSLLLRGARAVIGHVGRAHTNSFSFYDRTQIGAFEEVLRLLLGGRTVGYSLEPFKQKLMLLSADLLLNRDLRTLATEGERATVARTLRDARSLTIVGDPAVRLPTGPDTTTLSSKKP